MHVIEPIRYRVQPQRRARLWHIAPVFLLLAALCVTNYLRPLPAPTATFQLRTPAARADPTLSWPGGGQAAVAAQGYGLLDTYGQQKPFPTASIAKVIAALCVLQKQPLAVGQSGPPYTIDATDVALYQNYVEQDDSLLQVALGEQLTEYQALQALMIPSANNIADSLVRWVFGSQHAYAVYAANWLQTHGLNATTIGSDASGFDSSTTSTAGDLAELGLIAQRNPVLMQIAGQSSTVLPLVGSVNNYDTVLGQAGITGLKTGNNDIDLGAFAFTATAHISDKTVPLAGAIMGAPSLAAALQASVQLAGSLAAGFEQVTVAHAGQTVGVVHAAWGASAPIVTNHAAQLIRWQATPITEKHTIDTARRSGTVGTLRASAGPTTTTTTLKLARPFAGPTFWWRLLRH